MRTGGAAQARTPGATDTRAGAARTPGTAGQRAGTAGTRGNVANRSTRTNRDMSSRNVNRNTNRDVNRDVDIDGDYGSYGWGGYYGAPIARGVAWGAAAGITAAAIGSVAYSLPAGCGNVYYSGNPYYNCGGTYYAPQYSGTDVTYVVVEAPEEEESTEVIVNPEHAPPLP